MKSSTNNCLRHEFIQDDSDPFVVFETRQSDTFWRRKGEICPTFTDLSFSMGLRFAEQGKVQHVKLMTGPTYEMYVAAREATNLRWNAANELRAEMREVFNRSAIIESLWHKDLFSYVLSWEAPRVIQDEFKVVLDKDGVSVGKHSTIEYASIASAKEIINQLCKDPSIAEVLQIEENQSPIVSALAEAIKLKMQPHFLERAA